MKTLRAGTYDAFEWVTSDYEYTELGIKELFGHLLEQAESYVKFDGLDAKFLDNFSDDLLADLVEAISNNFDIFLMQKLEHLGSFLDGGFEIGVIEG